jgi:hypothetical protein
MATVVQPMIEPNRDAIFEHLSQLFAPCRSEYPDGQVELRHGPPDNLTGHAYFFVTEHGLTMAADHAARRNRLGENVYVGVNPRKPGVKGQASAEGVEIAFFHFADIDKAEAVTSLVERYGVLPPTMTVTTGSYPNKRPHLYWRLEEPVRNLAEWTERQRGIAQALGGDAVIDPPRIMRLAGTVNFPTQKKLSAGYRVELTSLRTEFPNERVDVTPDMVRQAFPPRQSYNATLELGSGQTTLSAMSTRTRVSDLIMAVRSGDQWHNNMNRLVAHLVATGRTDAEILGLAAGLTLAGYTADHTLREMATSLRGARTKWNVPEPLDDVAAEESGREDGDSVFELLDLDQLENLPAPTWLIHELIAEHGLSIVYGDPGTYKSFIVLDMALRIAFGMDWHGTNTRRCGVLYIAGEGSRGLGKRVKGWRREHALEGADAPFLLLPLAVQMLDPKDRAKLCRTIDAAKLRAGFDIALVVIDTVSRAIAGQDENGQEAMSLFVGGCAEIQLHTGGAVIGVHHAGKDKERGMRGSTVLLGGCDASLKIEKSIEQRVEIKVEKQKDAEEAQPIHMQMRKVEWAQGLSNEESTLVPFLAPRISAQDEKQLSKKDVTQIFEMVSHGWGEGSPWGNQVQAKRRGKYLPSKMAEMFGVSEASAERYIEDWQTNDYLRTELCDSRNRVSGLRVLKLLEQDQ